ncbi:MAG: 8-oxo-dGTP diphosphatase [Sporolactobacillus sp.]
MLRYTLAMIRHKDELLMINRKKKPWQGCWNGIGGKLEVDESPKACVLREIWEETGLRPGTVVYRGIASWQAEGAAVEGMYLFLADISTEQKPVTPIATREGILDWKAIDWIVSKETVGAVPSLRFFMKEVLHPEAWEAADFHFAFDGSQLLHAEKRPLPEEFSGSGLFGVSTSSRH